MDRLAALGYLPSAFSGMRPWTRSECARLVLQAGRVIDGDQAAGGEAAALYRERQQEFFPQRKNVRPFTPMSLKQLAEDVGFRAWHIEYLPWCRGIGRILRYLGKEAAAHYLRLSDSLLRRIGFLNRRHLMLEARK